MRFPGKRIVKEWNALWFNQARRDIQGEVSKQLDERLEKTPINRIPHVDLTNVVPGDSPKNLVDKAVKKSYENSSEIANILRASLRQLERRQESLEALVLATKSRDAVDTLLAEAQKNPDIGKRLGEYGISMEHIVKLRDVVVKFVENISTSGHYQELFRGIKDSAESAILATEQLNRTAKATKKWVGALVIGALVTYVGFEWSRSRVYGPKLIELRTEVDSLKTYSSKLERRLKEVSTEVEKKTDKDYVQLEITKTKKQAGDELDSFKVAVKEHQDGSQMRLNESYSRISSTDKSLESLEKAYSAQQKFYLDEVQTIIKHLGTNDQKIIAGEIRYQALTKEQEESSKKVNERLDSLDKAIREIHVIPTYRVESNFYLCPIDFKGLSIGEK